MASAFGVCVFFLNQVLPYLKILYLSIYIFLQCFLCFIKNFKSCGIYFGIWYKIRI